ncbi:MAG: oxidoreductase FAD/NAD(P)-binding subunit, CDP-4-dehydro-6-deoxyglucose reductase [Microgenomates group bacterium GW2011_GWC1_39_12]|nr:MAG: oxidoreductase FAD/NAD(P)-binding subunit, CDP-4-dehydro-6-deoxyglucose reductase [Microgenomates group bacterium GW2011_GWC1_39_12]
MQYMGSPFQQTATVTNKLQLSPHVYEFTFQVPREMTFMPGQYATFIIDNQTRRQYSFASPCINPKEFEIVVDVTPMGPGSKFFLEKNVGDAIEILAPLGTFYLDIPTTSVVFIATGTGIVPFRTMIEEYLTSGGKENIVLLWGLRHEEDIFWKDILEGWQQKYPNFHYSIVLSKPSDSWQGKKGHVTEHIREEILTIETHTFYLCGNRHMISDVKTDLLAHQVPEDYIKTEMF